MSEGYQIKRIGDLSEIYDSRRLEREANILLYGDPDVREEAMRRQIFLRSIYIPVHMSRPLIYRVPKLSKEKLPCEECGRVRSDGSSSLCMFCYRVRSRLRFLDKRDGLAYWEKQLYGGRENESRVGIVMPVTEWWDDHDALQISAHPRRLYLDWNSNRLAWS